MAIQLGDMTDEELKNIAKNRYKDVYAQITPTLSSQDP
jgi:hypothetical protein